MDYLKHGVDLMKSQGYRSTGSRVGVLKVLSKAGGPLSPYDVHELMPAHSKSSVSTIYRVLETLEALGIAHRVHTKEGFVRCHFPDQKGCHTFAVCKDCGSSAEYVDPSCAAEKKMPKGLTLKVERHISEIAGTCTHCISNHQ